VLERTPFLDQAGHWALQLAGEFLGMAVTPHEIKSRELFPELEQPAGGESRVIEIRAANSCPIARLSPLKDHSTGLEAARRMVVTAHPRGMDDDIPNRLTSRTPESDRSLALEALIDVDLYALFAAFEK